MEQLQCAECGNILSRPVRRIPLPPQPPGSLLSHYRPNPPLLEPGTYAVDDAEFGRRQARGMLVLSPGDALGTVFVHEWCQVGCWSLHAAWGPSMACEGCGTLVAGRTDDCNVAQETRFYPDAVVLTTCDAEPPAADPFALGADWDDGPAAADSRWLPQPTRRRTELIGTRWRTRGLRAAVFRDDPPA